MIQVPIPRAQTELPLTAGTPVQPLDARRPPYYAGPALHPTESAHPRPLADLLAGLPPQPDPDALLPAIRAALADDGRPLAVVDDDPTGTQTVQDVPLLLDWSADEARALARERNDGLFFLLTNSRALPESSAATLNRAVGSALGGQDGPLCAVASRSDSTLRGHYPAEVLALQEGLGGRFHGHLLVPAFVEGGRYTVDDVHWVEVPQAGSGQVVPASATPFARDPTFGYTTAHLPRWVEARSGGRWRAAEVATLPLAVVRAGPDAVRDRLLAVDGSVPVVVNAVGYGDLASVALGVLWAEARGKRFLYRTAASFVRVRGGQEQPAPPRLTDAVPAGPNAAGSLVVVGSYVPATTAQVRALLEAPGLDMAAVEVDVPAVLAGGFRPESAAARLDAALAAGRLALLATSRDLVAGGPGEHLAIGQQVTDALVATVAAVSVRPRVVVAKGGITSHEVARRGLGARRARVLGPLLPGVPLWRLEDATRHAGVPYVVFPGNVGGAGGLLDALRALGVAPAPAP